jgi:hypothetical protein
MDPCRDRTQALVAVAILASVACDNQLDPILRPAADGGVSHGGKWGAPGAPPNSTALHIAPAAAGKADGSSPSNAGSPAQLNEFIRAAGPGGVVCLEPGTYGVEHDIVAGGIAGAPVTLLGTSGQTRFVSNFDASSGDKFGPIAFRVRASHLIFEGLEFEHVGECFHFDADVEAVTLSRFRARNVATCVNVDRGGTQAVRGLTISQAMILQFTRGAIFFGGQTDGALVEDTYIDMQPEQIGGHGSDFPVGIAFYDATRNVEVSHTTVLNVVGSPAAYQQGDGTDGESSAGDILIRDSYFRGCRDACASAKTQATIIRDTIAAECKLNFSLWLENTQPEGGTCQRCSSYQPTDAHFSAHGGEGVVTDVTVYSSNAARLAFEENGGVVRVEGVSGTLPSPDALNAGYVTGANLDYDATFAVPSAPNPTPFMP